MSTQSSATARRTRSSRPTAAERRARERRRARRRQVVVAIVSLAVLGLAGVLVIGGLNSAVNRMTRLPLEHANIIREQAAAKDLDPALIAAVIYTETHFQPRTSSAGAEGLMQITPDTAKFIAGKSGGTAFKVEDLATPEVNIAYGAWYLRYLSERYDGDKEKMLAAYNGGEGNVDKWVAAAAAEGRSFAVSDIPFPETRAYVQNVLARQREYRRDFAKELGY